MLRYLRYYLTATKTSMLQELQYRVAMIIWLLVLVMEPIIFLVVWQAAASAQGGVAGHYTAGEFAAYFMCVMVVNHLTFTWIIFEYSLLIREGRLAGRLIHPIHPIHRDICNNVAYKLLTVVLLVPVLVLMQIVFRPQFHIGLGQVLAFLPALVLAALGRFLLEWTLAQLAFWLVDISAANLFYMTVLMFFSGRVAPIDLFPAGFETIARRLPFPWFLAFPVEILMGTLDLPAILNGYAVQLAWCAGILLFLQGIWKAAIRQFGAVGA